MAGFSVKLATILMNLVRGPHLGEYNKKIGEAFQAANRAKPGVTTTKSGLQYEILRQGDGPKPLPSCTVVIHYQGTLVNGAEFDNSYQRGEPLTIKLFQCIEGWQEGLRLLSVGGQIRLVIPPALGYGRTKAGLVIGPEATLLFDIELLEIK